MSLIAEETLIQWIKEGGANLSRGVEGLFQLYGKKIKWYLMRKGVAEDEAADILHETFIKLMTKGQTFRGESRIGSWLYQIANNLMKDRCRDPDNHHLAIGKLQEECGDAWEYEPDAEDDDQPAMGARDLVTKLCVEKAWAMFTRDNRSCADVLLLAVFEGFSTGELAQAINRAEGATREFLSQCRKKISPYLAPCAS